MALAVGGLIAKVLGALYRIPLTNILGAEGMGMYQLVFPVFALFMVLSSAGIPTALSRIVAEKRAAGENGKKYLFAALMLLVGLSALFSVLILALSKPLAQFQGNGDVALGYALIAPSILFIGVIAGLRGWFQGQMLMLPTALSNVIEQLVKLCVGIALAVVLAPKGVIAAVCGAIIGVTVSELVTMIYLIITYAVKESKNGIRGARGSVSREEARQMFKVAFPIALVAVLLPLSNFFDSLIIVNVLKWAGEGTSLATAEYGLLSGPVMSLVNMPVVVIMSLAIAIVPSVSVSRVERDIDGIVTKSRLSLKLAYMIGVPVAGFVMVYARQLLAFLYPTLSETQLLTSSNLLLITAPNVVLMSSMQIYVSLLQALDKTYSAVRSIVIAIIVKIVLSVVLVRFVGIIGAATATLCLGIVSLGLCNIAFLRLTSIRLEKNVGGALFAGITALLASIVPREFIGNDMVALIVGFVVFYIIYFWLVILFGFFEKSEFGALPFGKIYGYLHRIIRFWEYGEKNDYSG